MEPIDPILVVKAVISIMSFMLTKIEDDTGEMTLMQVITSIWDFPLSREEMQQTEATP